VLVEPYADMYRAAVLELPEGKQATEEYCLFAATTGSLSTVEVSSMTIVGKGSTVNPIAGTIEVDGGAYHDGTLDFYVRDSGQRDIASVFSISILRVFGAGASPPLLITTLVTTTDSTIGKITIEDAAVITQLGGGFSVERGDVLLASAYILASPSFWWSRNDADLTRFGWDGKSSRWLPLQGGAARNMGAVLPDTGYKLSPPPTRFEIGDTLPGSSSFPDAYGVVRIGLYADADSTPLDILVVSDLAASGEWQSGGSPDWDGYEAVVGVTNGVLLLNPSFVSDQAGRTLWYNAETYQSDADGDLGAMADLPVGSNQGFPSLSPVPGPTDRPFLRIGSRRYLTPIPRDNDTDLNAPSGVSTGSFEWSKATGKIVLSDIDIAKCIPGSNVTPDSDPADYEIPFLGARLYYDGVSLNTQALPLKAAVPALNEDGLPLDGSGEFNVVASGEVYVPRAVCMPPPGVSGVRWEQDDTGDTPVVPGTATTPSDEPQTRPNGTGLVRRVSGGASTRIYGDTFFFSKNYAYENTDVIEYTGDLKNFAFAVPKNEVEISRMSDPLDQPADWTNTSRTQFRRRPVKGDPLYFRQAELTPSVYADEAKVFSRLTEPYSIVGTEIIRFRIDAQEYEWGASNLNPTGIAADYTAEEVAADLIANGGVPTANVGVLRGRIFLQADTLSTGSVEIGWNDPGGAYPHTDATDLSGHAALGLLPGWRVDLSDGEDRFRWLPDNGACLGVFRSPVNMDRTDSTPDIRAVGRVTDTVLSTSIPANPNVTLSPPPLVDVPGYTDTSHFEVVVGLLTIRLENYQTTLDVGVVYDWVENRFTWCEKGRTGGTQVPYPTSTLQLDDTYVFPETVSPLAMDDASFGLNLRRATDVAGQTLPADFDVPEDLTGELTTIDFAMTGTGGPGQAVLLTPEGAEAAAGGKGETVAGSGAFADENVSDQTELYDAVEPGYLLHILSGDNEGIYTILTKELVFPVVFEVSPVFPATDAGTQWRIYEAKKRDKIDLTLLADVQQVATSHFPENPFKVRTLTSVGQVGVTPLKANVVDAMASGRTVSLRFGLDPITANERTVSYLAQGTNLGSVVATGLVCPDPTDIHLTLSGGAAAYFQIRVGAKVYSLAAGNMTLDTGTPAVDEIDVSTAGVTVGEILVGADVVDDLTGSTVYYDQLFLAQADVPAGTCEIAPLDGSVNILSTDATDYDQDTAYFVEQMVTDNDRDAKINPMNGSLLFMQPLRAMQIVEVNYFQADTNGDKKLDENGNPVEITEFLPLMVTLEVCTYVSDTKWTYNPTGRTLSTTVDPMMWVGTNLMNYAGVKNAEASAGVLTITTEASALLEADSSTAVKINYGVLEAFGGETAYTVSKPPVFCKPFWIPANTSTFTLETDRTADFVAGLLMVLGPTPLYIDASAYDAATDLTTVAIYPTPENEVGSRAPGRDAGLTLSDFLVSVDRGGSTGFMPTLDTVTTPLLECDRGQTSVSFYGDVRLYMQTNHLLEIGGYPYIIVSASLSDDGYNTIVMVGTPLYAAHDNEDLVRVSVRQLYFDPPVEFAGISPFVPSEEYDLFLMGHTDSSGALLPGKVLVEALDYTIEPTTGAVTFQAPTQKALQAGEYLHLRYTRLISVGPTVADGAVVYPVYRGKYLYMTTPTVDNRLLGAVLKGEYSYRSQDSFFYSVQTLEDYLGEVSVVSSSQGVVPYSGGPTFFQGPQTGASKQGGYGLRGGVVDAKDQDRAARVFVEFFNGVVLAFEQVLEAIDGRLIGDRDGKFRFFIGHDKRYTPPGYEDAITGDLNQRLLWRDIIDAWAPSAFEDLYGYYRTKDALYLPTTAFVPEPLTRPGETDGLALDPFSFWSFTARQRRLIKNDMDDRILKGMGRPKVEFFIPFMFPYLRFKGNFDDMWENHRFSRLFPTETEHFSMLFPGINYDPEAMDPGFFTPGRDIEMPGPEPGETSIQTVRTFGNPNGAISNNALGEIPNIIDVSVKDRLPRGRVWAYYPNGFTMAGLSTPHACLVVTVLTMDQFPIDPDTGFPDTNISTGLITGPGDGIVYSVVSGNPDLSTPPFEVGQRVNYGKPDGTLYSLSDSDGLGIYIQAVEAGCVLILGTSDGAFVPTITATTGNNIYTDVANGTRLSDTASVDDGYSDTVYIGVGVGAQDIDEEEPTTEDLELLAASMPEYRQFFDVGLRRKAGELIDITFPGPDDNFFLNVQAMFGQRPPDPLSCVEGTVKFINTDSEPLKLPCLLGEDKDDSGDQQIPFMRGTPNEIMVLREVAPLLEGVYLDTSVALPYGPNYYKHWDGSAWVISVNETQYFPAVYPDETFVGDGALYEEAVWGGYPQNPATLYTDRDLNEAAVWAVDHPTLTANTGLGDLRRFDLLFSQVGQTAVTDADWKGLTGILDVGDVVYDVVANPGGALSGKGTIEIPRFVTPTQRGNLHRYTLNGWAARVDAVEGGGQGVEIVASTVIAPNVWETVIDFSNVDDMPNLSLLTYLINQTTHGGNVPVLEKNAFVIRIYNPDPLAPVAFLGAVTIISGVGMMVRHYFYNAVTGVLQAPYVAAPPAWGSDEITLRYNDTAPGSPDSLEVALGLTPGTRYDFRLDLDTYGASTLDHVTGNTGLLLNAMYGTETATVLRDRLTFTEELDVSLAKDRDYQPAKPGTSFRLGAAFNLWEFEANGVLLAVNDRHEINGGDALTYLNRVHPNATEYVGTYNGATNTGALRAMSWEGHENTPIPSALTGITLSAASSSDLDESAIICANTGAFWDGDSDLALVDTNLTMPFYKLEGNRNYMLTTAGVAGQGSLSSVVAGDICVVGKNPVGGASPEDGVVKAGTYLVRHAIPQGGESTPATSNLPDAELLAARQRPGSTEPFPAAEAAAFAPRVDTVPTSSGMSLVPPSGEGCLDLTFPTIQEVTGSPSPLRQITLTGVVPVFGTSTGCGWDDPTVVGSYRLYVVLKDQYATFNADAGGPGTPGWDVDAEAVWSVEVTSIVTPYDADTQTITFDADDTSVKRACPTPLGVLPVWADFQDKAVVGTRVSGMTRFQLKQMGSHLPANNMVGADYIDDGASWPLMAGFRWITMGNRNGTMLNPYLAAPYADNVSALWQAGVNLTHSLGIGHAPMDIVVNLPLPVDNTEFYEDRGQPVYGRMYRPGAVAIEPVAGVPTSLNLHQFGTTVWMQLHFGTILDRYNGGLVVTEVMGCLLPFDRFTFGSNIDPNGDGTVGDPGYYALSGVFIEPSFPRPVTNINSTAAKVTSLTHHDLTVGQIGARDFRPFDLTSISPAFYEEVVFAIRRPRRFHQIQVDIINLIEPLRYVYEIRRGFMDTYDAATRTLVADTTVYDGYATNLGAFNNRDVNINPGDVVRVVNGYGEVLDTAEIQRVENANTLILRRPGLTNPALVGDEEFEVYLEQAIVPHEQSNEQLLELLTQEVVYTRHVDYIDPAEPGGEVAVVNEMGDSDVADWSEKGVQEGDYIVIDPAGDLYVNQESGARPSGDMAVSSRTDVYVPGGPSKLDDNRGFYKVTAVGENSFGQAADTLIVSGDSRFTNGEIFGNNGAENSEYVVMPTIDGSWLTGVVGADGHEDQQALRPTAGPAGPSGDSYYDRSTAGVGDDGYKSIGPFGYKIIRPNTIFSEDTVELVLFTRERMLSWIDEITTLWDKGGDYYVFQRDDQIEDVGSDTDTAAGMGILSNLVVDSLKGLTAETPFANMSDCLSVLDRRFWVLDLTLDFQPVSGVTPTYTQFATGDYVQRPVEPDLIDGVLNTDDLFRDQRYGWITFRANGTDGSIRNATREQRTLTKRLKKQRQALIRQKGLDKA
jgi:hypothetical protein